MAIDHQAAQMAAPVADRTHRPELVDVAGCIDEKEAPPEGRKRPLVAYGLEPQPNPQQ